MKIWNATSAEHSAALHIVGTFEREQDALNTESILRGLIAAAIDATIEADDLERNECNSPAAKSSETKTLKWKEATETFQIMLDRDDFYELCLNEISVEPATGNCLKISSDEWKFQGLVWVLLERGARVEIFRY